MLFSALPQAQGLYDPQHESDSCGVAMVADIQGRRSHQIVNDGLMALEHLEHRGAAGAEPNSGDGAGILLQLPVELLADVVDFPLPAPTAAGENTYAAGICFLPQDPVARLEATQRVETIVRDEGLDVLGWRPVPVDPDGAEVGTTALGCMPYMSMLFVAATARNGVRPGGIALDRMVYPARKRAEQRDVYFPSLSSRTMAYKGMLTTMQLPKYFADLRDERCMSAIAIVHSRFSTNTFPSWPLAHPFRFVAHNGEINTVRGNRNRMHAREAMLASPAIPGDLERLSPICTPEASDSASFDQVLELLHLGGRSLPHAVMMMIPEAWENNTTLDPARRAFCQYHASLMEPWDGPACVTFTDGTVVGAVLDRNGLRPGRWWRTIDDRVILASESGVLDIPSGEVVAKGRLEPGRMFLIDTAAGRIISDDEIKAPAGGREALRRMAARRPAGPQDAAGPLPRAAEPRIGGPPPDRIRLHRGRPANPAHADGGRRPGAARLDGHRHPGRGSLATLQAALRLLRGVVRPGDQPAPGRHPRGDRHLAWPASWAPSRTCSAHRRLVSPDPAALAGSRQ